MKKYILTLILALASLGLYAGMHHGAEAAACLPADAHCGTAAEKEAGMIFWMA